MAKKLGAQASGYVTRGWGLGKFSGTSDLDLSLCPPDDFIGHADRFLVFGFLDGRSRPRITRLHCERSEPFGLAD